jgi:DNA polymerase III delta subunit
MERPASSRNKKSSGTNEANSAQVLEQIKRRQFRPVYLFFGPERYLLDELAAALKVALADEVNAGFDYDLLDGETSSLSAVLNLANTPPWLAERRLVLVKNAPWFRGNKKSKADNEETDSASPSTFVEPAEPGLQLNGKQPKGRIVVRRRPS